MAKTLYDASHIEEQNQQEFDLWTLTVLLSLASTNLDSSIEGFCTWSLDQTQRSTTHHWWWLSLASLVQFQDAWGCPDTPACTAVPGYHSAALLSSADLSHAQIFGNNLPDAVMVHAQLTCDQSNSQLPIAMHHLCPTLDASLSPAHWRRFTLEVVFLFEPNLPLEKLKTMTLSPLCSLFYSSQCCWQFSPNWTRNFSLICCSVSISWWLKIE